jgi:CxxC motif-containing protein (DUF1111 family)
MRKSTLIWSLVGIAAAIPIGLRVFTWHSHRPKAVDHVAAVAGAELFSHEWTPGDPLAAGGDGLGPVYNATSCVACHFQAGIGGGGALEQNVTVFSVSSAGGGKAHEGVVHARSTLEREETLQDVSAGLPAITRPPLDLLRTQLRSSRLPTAVLLSQRNTPALFGAKLIDDISDEHIIATERAERIRWGMAPADSEDKPVGRASRLPDGKLGRFGWKGQSASLASFVRAACANELGLGNSGQAQPAPLFPAELQGTRE